LIGLADKDSRGTTYARNRVAILRDKVLDIQFARLGRGDRGDGICRGRDVVFARRIICMAVAGNDDVVVDVVANRCRQRSQVEAAEPAEIQVGI
jgi:hypothetical protein